MTQKTEVMYELLGQYTFVQEAFIFAIGSMRHVTLLFMNRLHKTKSKVFRFSFVFLLFYLRLNDLVTFTTACWC